MTTTRLKKLRRGHRTALAMLVVFISGAPVACRRETHDTKGLASVGRQWTDAWNSRQRDQLLALFDPDLIFWWPTMKMPMRGRQDVDHYLQSLWGGWSSFEIHANGILVDEPAGKVAVDWTLAARDIQTGNPIQLEGVEILQVRNGVITADRGIFNSCSLLAQLKATPSSGATVNRTAAQGPAPTP